jgi:hypothetical protein
LVGREGGSAAGKVWTVWPELKVYDGKEGGRVRIEEQGAATTYTSEVDEKRRGVDRQAVMPKPSTPNQNRTPPNPK